MSRLRRVVAPVFGSAVLGGVAVLYLRPEWVLTAVPDLEALFAAIEPVVFLVGAVAMLGVAAVALVLRAKLFSSSSRTVDNTSERTESSQSLFAGAGAVHGQLGASFDVQFQMATDYGSTDRADREAARTQSIDELRSLAQDAYQQAAGCESETARRAIESGEWTTDQRAAGLLADDSGPSIPLRLWAWDLLVGRDPYVNSIDHTLTVLETVSKSGLGEEAA